MNVNFPTDQRINMSLDDLIKARNQQQKKKPAANKPKNNNNRPTAPAAKKQVKVGGVATAAGRPVSANKKTRTPKQNNKRNNSAMDVDVRVAKNVGTGRAMRNAQVNARRGLQASAVASKQDIRKEVNKQLQKKRPGSAGSAGSSSSVPSGLKISFRPGELAKTTEKVVSQQIKAVLSRQPSPRANASNNNSNPTGRAGPKARGNKVLRVVR